MLVYFGLFFTLKKEVIYSSETLATFQWTIGYHVPQARTLYILLLFTDAANNLVHIMLSGKANSKE
jgi:hypothetical protein